MKRVLLALAMLAVLTVFSASASADHCNRGGPVGAYGYRSYYRPIYSYYNRGPIFQNSYYQYYQTRSPYSRYGYSSYGAGYYGYPAGINYNLRSPGVNGLYRF